RRPRLFRNPENAFVNVQRRFGFAIDVDDVAEFLERAEYEERIDEQRKELTDRDSLRVDQVQHQKHDAGAQEVHRGALNEAQTSHVTNLLQLQLENLVRRRVQACDLLLRQPETLHQLDISQRFGRRSREGRRLRHDDLLYLLDAPAEYRTEEAKQRN